MALVPELRHWVENSMTKIPITRNAMKLSMPRAVPRM